MVLSTTDKGIISDRLRRVGVPGELTQPYFRLVLKWLEGSGLEWTVSRMKDVKTDFLRKKAGLPKSSKWIRSGRGSNWFSGPFGGLETYAFKSDLHFSKVITILNLYTSFIANRVTDKQAKKFLSGVAASAVTLPSKLIDAVSLGFQLSGLGPMKRKLHLPKPLLAYNPAFSKRGPTLMGSVPEEDSVIDSLFYLQYGGGLEHFLRNLRLYHPVMEGLEPELEYIVRDYTGYGIVSMPLPKPGPLFVGRIGLIQEPGLKLRAVANPGRVFQTVLEPLGKELFNTLKRLPWDCTFEQSKADDAIRASLSAGKQVYSVDLSGATDHFPLDLQIKVLNLLLPNSLDHVNLFAEISRGQWAVPTSFPKEVLAEYGYSNNYISWKKGQPLGLYPSFASFALTHGILLLGLLGREWNHEFYILGDDVVIMDDQLYTQYREALSLLSCPVSEPKTLQSRKVAEFRSVIFLDNMTIPQYKWRMPSDDSFIEVLRLNPYLYPCLQKRQRKVVDLISGLPVELGGLGWNAEGKPLSDRLSPFISILTAPYEPLERLMGYTLQARNLLQKSKMTKLVGSYRTIPNRYDVVSDLDQRSKELVRKSLGGTFVPLYELLGRNLDQVLNGDVDLPVVGVRDSSRRTVLAQWEATLSKLDLLRKV